MGEEQEKIFEIVTLQADAYAPGESVRIGITTGLGGKAVVLAYVIPCLVLFGTLVAVLAAGFSEGVAALSSLGATALYYLLLWTQRRKIENKIHFTITKN